MEYLFILGRTTDLCKAELEAVLKIQEIEHEIIHSSSEIIHLKTLERLDADQLIKTLGGTIKIGEAVGETGDVENLGDLRNKQFQFGLSGYGEFCFNDINHYSKEIKKALLQKGIKSRFVLPKDGTVISSVVIQKQKITEFILVKEFLKDKQKIIIGRTLAVQDFEEWGKRDFGRPEANPKAGMLPPKVARMMVNLASQGETLRNQILLDPFCGMGTILMEGMTRGYEAVGSDISEAAVQKTQKNLAWLVSEFKSLKVLSLKYKVFQADATHLSEKLSGNSVDAIVTEPYLGPNEFSIFNFQFSKIRNTITGLEKLYKGCLREWQRILKPGGTVVIIFPSFKLGNQEFFVKKVLDSCEILGYTLVAGPYQYFRPQAVVKRNIYILKLNYGTH